MSIENEEVLDDTSTTGVEQEVVSPGIEKARKDPRLTPEPKSENSIGHLLRKGMKESKETEDAVPMTSRERREAAKTTPAAEIKEPPAQTDSTPKIDVKDTSKENKPAETVLPTTPQASGIAPPAALTKEEKAVWDTTPKEMQEAFFRREKDVQKGIDQLKAKYQPIEDVLAPIKPLLQQSGLTEAQAVRQLFDWHRALSSPNTADKITAFKTLAQSHRFDINLLNPTPPAAQAANPQTQQGQPDPFAQFQPLLDQAINPLQQRISQYEAAMQQQKLDDANRELNTFSQDKPHFDKVRLRMAEILSTAAQFGRPVTLDDAYNEAVWGMPEIRSELMQAQEEKRMAEFQTQQAEAARKAQEEASLKARNDAETEQKRKEAEALEKAKRANVSPRSTTPTGGLVSGAPKKAQSVSDTLRNAIKESRVGV